MVNFSVIRSLAVAVLLVATGAATTADAAERAGQTLDATVATVNDGTHSPETSDHTRTPADDTVAANASASTAVTTSTNTSSSSASSSSDASSDANAEAADATIAAGGSASASVDSDDDATSSAAPIFLSTGDDTCMGSSGIGVQGMEFGFSVGSSWTDENCVMLKNARELKNQGHHKAAKARLCMNDENALAFEMAGEPCPRALPSTQAAIAQLRDWNPDYQVAAEPGPQVAVVVCGQRQRTDRPRQGFGNLFRQFRSDLQQCGLERRSRHDLDLNDNQPNRSGRNDSLCDSFS